MTMPRNGVPGGVSLLAHLIFIASLIMCPATPRARWWLCRKPDATAGGAVIGDRVWENETICSIASAICPIASVSCSIASAI